MGFEYTHPEKAKGQESSQERATEKTEVETAIEERKREAEAMRSNQQPHQKHEKKRWFEQLVRIVKMQIIRIIEWFGKVSVKQKTTERNN